ncbi:hypothetical protein BDN71DRAFT_1508952 [Pleurotus eryngii]|uniref:Uncharacterized protein n=1 Tax=Pleurotus eryngii TaxID=5323 RepID=A0A9P5ZUK2_PLEER|nr:hypothetical protein BDN71DRAFT_1508952 [Pleurotus eryngii]
MSPTGAEVGQKVSLDSYYKHIRAQRASAQTASERAAEKANARATQAKYRQNNHDTLRLKESLCRERKKLIALGFFDLSDHNDNYSEYEGMSDSSSSAASSDEEDWEAEATVYHDLRARAEAKRWQSGISDLLKRRPPLPKKAPAAYITTDVNCEAIYPFI